MSTDIRDRAREILQPVRDRTGPAVDRGYRLVTAHDALMVAVTLLVVYVFFALLVLDQGINSVVSTLRLVTFFAAVYAMLALALNLHWGYTGLFNIGVAGFMAVGVYTMGILTSAPTANPPGLGLPLWVGVVGGMAAAALVGLVAALPALRLKADYLAIVTLGLSEIIRLTFNSGWLDRRLVETVGVGTGAGSGLGLPANPVRAMFANPLGERILAVAESLGVRAPVVLDWAYVLLLIAGVAAFYWLLVRIGNSPFGRVLKAIRDDELVASSLGKNTRMFKIKVFMLGCALMGLAGILWQGSLGFVNPNSFLPVVTFYIFVAVIVGGSGSNTGSVIGGIIFAGLLFQGPRYVGSAIDRLLDLPNAPNTFYGAVTPLASLDVQPLISYSVSNIGALQFVLLGVVLIVLMQVRPEGMLGHRSETAAAVDLSERPARKTVADGGVSSNDDAGGDRR